MSERLELDEPGEVYEDAATAQPAPRPVAVVPVAAVAWAAAALLFVLLRFGPVIQAPVGGAEVEQLSGAWQARIGVADDRFVPTLFQAATALLLRVDASETAPRTLAFLATATVPLALWLVRRQLGEAGALVALLLLALDAPGIVLGSTASAMAADLAVTTWLFVFLVRGWPRWWAPGVAALLATLSGPLALPLVAGWAATVLWRREPLRPRPLLAAAGGAALGVLLASARFGIGFEELVVPPFDLFARGFAAEWSTATAAELALLYGWPAILGGAAAAGWMVARRRREPIPREAAILLAWAAFAVAWWLPAATSRQLVPVVALTTPLALLAGPAAVRLFATMLRADWRLSRYLLPLLALLVAFALANVIDWARLGQVGPGGDRVYVALWVLLALAAVVVIAAQREAAPTLAAPLFAVAGLTLAAGVFGVALSGREAPIPSPNAPVQARELRDLALATAGERRGPIVVHPDLQADATWPFRDSGNIIVASRVPLDAAFVVWPASLPAPEGMVAVQGQWALRRGVEPPTSGALAYFKWLIDRNSLEIISEPVAVYSRANP